MHVFMLIVARWILIVNAQHTLLNNWISVTMLIKKWVLISLRADNRKLNIRIFSQKCSTMMMMIKKKQSVCLGMASLNWNSFFSTSTSSFGNEVSSILDGNQALLRWKTSEAHCILFSMTSHPLILSLLIASIQTIDRLWLWSNHNSKYHHWK